MATDTRLRQVPDGWLLAQDLRDQPRLQDLHLAHHHIAAHRTWGCSTGLRVMLDDDGFVVTAGAAVDRCGRVAVLPEQVTTRFPAVSASTRIQSLPSRCRPLSKQRSALPTN